MAARSLSGIGLVLHPPPLPCVVANLESCPLNVSARDQDSGRARAEAPRGLALPRFDVLRRRQPYSACAVVREDVHQATRPDDDTRADDSGSWWGARFAFVKASTRTRFFPYLHATLNAPGTVLCAL